MEFDDEQLVSIIRYSMPEGMKDQAELAFYKYLRGIEARAARRADMGRNTYDAGYAEGFDAGMYAMGDMIGVDEEWYERILRPSQEGK